MQVNDIANVTVGLSAAPASQANFTVPMLLVDHADIPLYRRFIITTKSDYTSDLTASTDQYSWCTTLWSQNYNPSIAYIGRWLAAASSPQFICSGAVTTLATWTAISDGSGTVTTTAGADILTALDFSSVTSLADIALVINTAIASGGTSGATCTVDSLDNIVFTDPAVTGAGADTVVFSASGAGTHIELPAYLNIAGGFALGGADIEAPETAATTIFALDNTPFIICERGGTIANQVSLSTGMNALNKICILRITDVDAIDLSSTTDTAYQIQALGQQKTHLEYTENATQNPDAAVCGEIMPRTEASTAWANTALSGVSQSGLNIDGSTTEELTSSQISVLEGKGCDLLTKPSTLTHFKNGLAAGGNEMRVMIGKMYSEAKISEGIYAYQLQQNVVTFSDEDITAIGTIITYWLDLMVARKVLDAGYTLTLPAASTFTSATKATHIMSLTDVSQSVVQSAVNRVNVTLNWTV